MGTPTRAGAAAVAARPQVAALDCATFTLADTDSVAEVVAEVVFAGGGGGWVVSHWVPNAAGVGGAHMALTLQYPSVTPGSGGAARWVVGDAGAGRASADAGDRRWARLRLAARAVVDREVVFAEPDEIGLVMPGRAAGLPHLVASAAAAMKEHQGRSSGRAIIFPGSATVTGALTVSELLSRTAIEDVVGVADTTVEPHTVVHTFGFVRPVFENGRLVLPVVPYDGGAVAPFEVAHPTPCCSHH